VAVLTFLNVEGASAAALLLTAHPRASLFPTSAYGISKSLASLLGKGYDEVHVCGLGIKCELAELLNTLSRLKNEGTKTYWYCGDSYLNSLRADLEKHVSCRFAPHECGIVRAVLSFLPRKAASGAQAHKILRIGTNPDRREGESQADRDLRDLVRGSVWRYLNYRDRHAYPHAISVLAGVQTMDTILDRRTIETYRRSSDRVLSGKSVAMERVRDNVTKCGPAGSTVLITGETGTGKEIVARLIHEASDRCDAPFVPVNCAMLDGSLLEDMLFGHEKGAFTGAAEDRPGCFEEAHGGTLFLDEIGEIPSATQAKILRVLQEGQLRRLGGREDKRVDVRVIAATNRDLAEAVRAGRFRSDLYYRLAVLRIEIPPLRERPEDIPLLVQDILYRMCEEKGLPLPELNRRQLDTLKRQPWRGNVRELENVLARYVILGVKDVTEALEKQSEFEVSEDQIVPLEEFETRYMRAVYEKLGGNISRTAEALGVTRNTVKKKLC